MPTSPAHLHGIGSPFLIHTSFTLINRNACRTQFMCPPCFLQTVWPFLCYAVHGSHQIFLSSVITRGSGRFFLYRNCSSTHSLAPRPHMQHTLSLPSPAHSHRLRSHLIIYTFAHPNQPDCSSNSVRIHAPIYSNGLLILYLAVCGRNQIVLSSVIDHGSVGSLLCPDLLIYTHSDSFAAPSTNVYTATASSLTTPLQYSLKSHCRSH